MPSIMDKENEKIHCFVFLRPILALGNPAQAGWVTKNYYLQFHRGLYFSVDANEMVLYGNSHFAILGKNGENMIVERYERGPSGLVAVERFLLKPGTTRRGTKGWFHEDKVCAPYTQIRVLLWNPLQIPEQTKYLGSC